MPTNIIVDMSNIEEELKELAQNIPIEADKVIAKVGTKGRKEVIYSRYTVKISFIAGYLAYEACVNKLKEIFNIF